MTPAEDIQPVTCVHQPGRPSASLSHPDDPRLLRAVEEYLAERQAGRVPERQAFLARYAEIAAPLADCLDGLELIQAATPQLRASGLDSFGNSATGEIQPEGALGDFRLVREIGRGGMGVVYEAVQISLGRRVALKVLPFAGALDARQLQRFKNEAQAAAHLHHQSIVPVYGVGCERGVHYYAMQFIDGQTLANFIEEQRLQDGKGDRAAEMPLPPPAGADALEATGPYAPALPAADTIPPPAATASTEPSHRSPAFFRMAAGLALQAAEGLEHAHQLGVVHRDIKPANLLVDGCGKLWITDFGLAHCQNQAGLTMTGDLIGTLRYMSPEQALAQRVRIDHRTDIYSLGVTVYELLTLKPAFDGRDRQELLRQIAFEEPRAPRRWNKAIPDELEIVTLKAMAKHPDERYATAQELANDLRRYLDDKAICARRPTLVQKMRRWARQHKGVVWTMLASAVLLLAAVAVVASLAALRLEVEQQATYRQLLLTKEAEKKATQQLYDSLTAQVRAGRLSRRIGQRFNSLETLTKAVQMARAMNLPDEEFLKLRNEAIACLVLPDLRVAQEWDGWPAGSISADFDDALQRYARVDRQGVVHVHRMADKAEIRRFAPFGPGNFGHGRGIWPRLSADGRFLLLIYGGRAQVWDLAGQEPIRILEQAASGWASDFRPDSRQLALCHADGSLVLYDLPSGRQLQRCRGVANPDRLAFHPTAQQVAISHAAGVQVLDLATGSVLADLPHSNGAFNLAWHPDGKTLASVCRDRSISLWDVATRKRIAHLEGHKDDGLDFAFNHAGDLLASGCWDGTLRLWNPRTGQLLFSTPGYNLNLLRFSPDDRLLAAQTEDNKLRLWQVSRARGYRTLVRDPVLGRGEYYTCSIHPKAPLLAVGMWDGVGLWDLPSGKPLDFLPVGRCRTVQFTASGDLLTNGPAGLLRWPIQSDSAAGLVRIGPPQKLPVPGTIDWIGASRDGRVVASAQYWGALVWRQDQPEAPIRLSPHEDARFIDVSPDGRWVATGSHWGTKVKIWNVQTGKLSHELPIETGSLVRFSPDGRWLCTTGGGCRLWAVDSWKEGPHIGGSLFAFSPDSKLVAVETEHGVIRLVCANTGREYARLEDPNQDQSHSLCFSSDGAHLVSCTHGSWSVHVWDLRKLRGHLAEMELDWDLPPYPPAAASADRPLLRVEVVLGDVLNEYFALTKNQEAWRLATDPEAKSRDPRRAVELAKQAVALAPKEGMYWNTLGVAHYRAGHWDESIAALEKSMQLEAGKLESFDTFFLAMAHWRRNDKEQARQWYDRAVQWMEKHKMSQEELHRFRAEAAALLGEKPKKD